MSAPEFEHAPPFVPRGFRFHLFREAPQRRTRADHANLLRDLERIAASAPHLLADVGFERDRAASSPGREVWRSGAICVTVCTATMAITVSEN